MSDADPNASESTLDADPGEAVEVIGRARRDQSPLVLVGISAIAVLLMIWLVVGRGSPPDQPVAGQDEEEPAPITTAAPIEQLPTTTAPLPQPPAVESSTVDVQDLGRQPDLPGWRLVAGDGHNIEVIDLATGERRRHSAVGAPMTVDGDRLLLYQNSELFWLPVDGLDLDGSIGSESLTGVPSLQVMFVRPRSTDRPVLVELDGRPRSAIWWPNNNTDPQQWLLIDLFDGTTIDEISLSSDVFGGPDVVSTLGSGAFERLDGQWVSLGNLFVTSVSESAVTGQRCESPDQCDVVLVDRRTGSVDSLIESSLNPTQARLIRPSDRIVLIADQGILDLETGRFNSLPGLESDSLAVNSQSIVAAVTELSIGEKVATISLVDVDQGAQAELAVDLVPRWLVLMPPQ